jgi:hypothetical protein
VILGADTRATEGEIVCDKNCEKIHYLAPNISCCGAGTAADTENVTGLFVNGDFPSIVPISLLLILLQSSSGVTAYLSQGPCTKEIGNTKSDAQHM